MTPLSRRNFLLGSAGILSAPLFGCSTSPSPRPLGKIVGGPASVGHRLRGGSFPSPTRSERSEIIIVGGGVAGLSAAWWLKRLGHNDFRILELHSEVGGNSLSGENATSPYPWGAHYVPIPNKESEYVRILFEELGVIESYDSSGAPLFKEEYLCAAPTERLYRNGKWQEGLIPIERVSSADRDQYHYFFEVIHQFRHAVGGDGKRAFAIPMELSSRDPLYTALDKISFKEYLSSLSITSETLLWYLEYCCRDDYGSTLEVTSAWAGIHYFAARKGWAGNAGEQDLVTWPEGNGWLVKKLREISREHITTNALVFNISRSEAGVGISYVDAVTNEACELKGSAAIVCTPRFVAGHVVEELRNNHPEYLRAFEYSPWMVANLTLDEPFEANDIPLSWDNVLYGSKSLGYVNATHQLFELNHKGTVLTYYMPLSWNNPKQAREEALATEYAQWCEMIFSDLSHAHPKIREQAKELNVWVWGHGMIRPTPGFIWGEARQKALAPLEPIYFANSDMSGLSLFEEAQYRGIFAAKAALAGPKVKM